LLGDVHAEPELRYFTVKAIREQYECKWSHEYVRIFQVLAKTLTIIVAAKRASNGPAPQTFHYRDELIGTLNGGLKTTVNAAYTREKLVELFTQSCIAAKYLIPDYAYGYARVLPGTIDSEFLLSHLFGLPTSITGFDELLGGGGLILVEPLSNEPEPHRGRTVLTLGRFGTGKSLFSLQMAAEVAKKGGLAWYMPLEQEPKDCLHALESVGSLIHDPRIPVASTVPRANAITEQRIPDQGGLVILRSIKESFEDFRSAFMDNVNRMGRYPLRLIIVDPINAIVRGKDVDVQKLRADASEMFEEAKQKGVNVWLTAETETGQSEDLLAWQNIADTVFYFALSDDHGYVQRYFEVTKSRLQREQRGRHPFSIESGSGLVISPSPAAVRARLQPRRVLPPTTPIRFGWAEFDGALGPGAIYAGDVIALVGAGGSFKTPFGLEFVFGTDRSTNQGRTESLFVAARDPETSVRDLIKRWLSIRKRKAKSIKDIRICCLQAGFIKPGRILQMIEGHIVSARKSGRVVDRVMIDDIAHWEMSAPFVSRDHSFGDALVDLLRRYEVTSLIVCDRSDASEAAVLQRSIIDNADCLVEFAPVDMQGSIRTTIRIRKSRGGGHSREAMELQATPRGFQLQPSFSLLRVEDGHVNRTIPVRLFLHSESKMQNDYNASIREMLSSFMETQVSVEPQERFQLSAAQRLGLIAGIDELHVVQLDEFQFPYETSHSGSVTNKLGGLLTRSSTRDSGWYSAALERRAVPFYGNVGLLAYRVNQVDLAKLQSWPDIAEECDIRKEDRFPFFDFPMDASENFNCLFLEILHSLQEPPHRTGVCDLREWLSGPAAIEACKLYRRLCRKAYFLRESTGLVSDDERANLLRHTVVWRHWYTTLNQMMSEMTVEERRGIRVISLPQDRSVAGEWFLAVPAYSAAHEVGLRIVELLTTPDAELDRARLGVGLPTRPQFYEEGSRLVSPYFSIVGTRLADIMKKRFKRSEFHCYGQISRVLTLHLRGILELPDETESKVETGIREMMQSLNAAIMFLRARGVCNSCRASKTISNIQPPKTQ
jgi:KaiC/GvpD/RAD55 family RecA-like ATPase